VKDEIRFGEVARDRLLGVAGQLVRKDGMRPAPKSKNRAHSGPMEMRAIALGSRRVRW
jgi:hypothetical protein